MAVEVPMDRVAELRFSSDRVVPVSDLKASGEQTEGIVHAPWPVARVRSSPWCRCLDTASLAFGRADRWAALGSPRGASEGSHAASLRELRHPAIRPDKSE